MYHKVGAPVARRHDRFLNVSAAHFRRQMHGLAALGFHARPFSEVVEALLCRHSLPPRTLAITFDDGYQCIGDVAAPILAEVGFQATVFVVSQGVGNLSVWDSLEGRPIQPLLDWERLRGLAAAGWEVGGHTRSHPHLDHLDDAAAFAEIGAGREETETLLGEPILTFCYPYGHFNRRTPALVRRAGYLGACTVRSGLAQADSDPFLLPRVKVAYSDGMFGLLYRLMVRPSLPNVRFLRRSHRTRVPARNLT